MKSEESAIEVNKSVSRSKSILVRKGVEMALKHMTSLNNMIKNPLAYPLEKFDEKIAALDNYTFLLDALSRDIDIE